ncbi:MAG TPA: 30S ribosomal protein S21 [Chloroflexota bacterium]|jgi:ribosomal protein S21|nr:30S ribosomal protein S21 [Chloroflexota bacterium]HXT35386.1 30S ribosomal protein S21 [Chloroflexota bacterium]
MVETISGESFERLLKRFKKEVAQDGILRVYREKSRFQTKRMREQTKRKRAARKAQKRRTPTA